MVPCMLKNCFHLHPPASFHHEMTCCVPTGRSNVLPPQKLTVHAKAQLIGIIGYNYVATLQSNWSAVGLTLSPASEISFLPAVLPDTTDGTWNTGQKYGARKRDTSIDSPLPPPPTGIISSACFVGEFLWSGCSQMLLHQVLFLPCLRKWA